MRTGYAMTAVTLHKIDILLQPAKLRHARQRQQEIAAPAEVQLHVLQLRESAAQLGPDQRFDMAGSRAP